MRLFLAVPLSDELQSSIAEMIERLRLCEADVRWVDPHNLHLTVAFLGDRLDDRLPETERIGEIIAGETAPFRISVRGLSAFPRKGPALKTLYAGLFEGAAEWTALAKRTEFAFSALGIPPSNDLIPHLTLGRVKGVRGVDGLRAVLQHDAETEFGTQLVDRMTLIESKLDPAGAIYRNIRTCLFPALEEM